MNVPISLMAAVAASRLVHESRAEGDTTYDVPGAVTATGGLVALVYGLTTASTNGWTSSTTLGFLGLAVLLLVSFVVIELRASHPLLPLRILLDRNRGGSFLSSFLVGTGMMGMFLFLTFYFQGTLHYSALKAGFAFLPFSLGIIVAATAASRVLPRFGPRPMMIAGFLAASIGLAWLTQIGAETSFLTHVLPAEMLISLGMGFAFVPMSSTALLGVDPHDAGVASATLNASQQIGGSLGTALLNTIFATATSAYLVAHGHSPSDLVAAQIHGYHVGFLFGAGALLAAAVTAFALVKTTRGRLAPAPAVAVAD